MKYIQAAMVLPSVKGFSGGIKRTLKILENADRAAIEFTVFTPINEKYDRGTLCILKRLKRKHLVDVESAERRDNASCKDFEIVIIPEEYWLTSMCIIKKLRLKGPYAIIFQNIPWIGSLDVLEVQKKDEINIIDLLSMSRLRKRLFIDSPINSRLRVLLGIPYIQALKFFHNYYDIGTCKTMAYQLRTLGFKNSYTIDPMYGVDYNAVKRAKEEYNGKIIYDAFYSSRFVPEKGFFDLLHIVYTAKKIVRKDIKIAVLGIPQKKRHVELFWNTVKMLNLDTNITFLGKLSQKNLFKTSLQSKLLIYPSYSDSFSLTIAETLALGVPVLAYDIDALRFEWDQYQSILRVKVGDYEAMGKKFAHLIKHDNIGAIKTIAENESIDVVRRLSWDNVIKAERGFYEWVIGKRHA